MTALTIIQITLNSSLDTDLAEIVQYSSFECTVLLGNGNRFYDLTKLQRSASETPSELYFSISGFKTERIIFNLCSEIPVQELQNYQYKQSCGRFETTPRSAYLLGHGSERQPDG